jgi:hypothetical protein
MALGKSGIIACVEKSNVGMNGESKPIADAFRAAVEAAQK